MNRILIIEDDKTLRGELKTLLDNSGYSAVCAEDFSKTLDIMLHFDGELILLDINLPFTNGETLLRDFRRKSDTPVIMLTSRVTELDEVLSMSMGADDYITKPYNPTILLLRISAVLKRTQKAEVRRSYRGLILSAQTQSRASSRK